jgi:hypothetical protein
VLSRSPSVHPIGARSAGQLCDNLGALDVDLPRDALDRLTAASAIDLGFPHDFIADNSRWVFGAADVSQPDGAGEDGG